MLNKLTVSRNCADSGVIFCQKTFHILGKGEQKGFMFPESFIALPLVILIFSDMESCCLIIKIIDCQKVFTYNNNVTSQRTRHDMFCCCYKTSQVS